jgi:citrate lyase beta subunit
VPFRIQIVRENFRLIVYGDENATSGEFPVVRLTDPDIQTAIDSLIASGAGTVLLADCRGAETLQRCDMALSVAEARAGRVAGEVRIIAGMESATGVIGIATLGEKSARLTGLAWSPQAFCADMACPVDSAITDHAWAQVLIFARAFHLPAYVFADDQNR